MQIFVIVLAALNLLLIVTVLAVVLIRTRSSDAEFETVRKDLRGEQVLLRQDQAQQRQEIGQTLNDMRSLLDERIRTGIETQLAELSRERESRLKANRELHELLDYAINKTLANTIKNALEENALRVRELTESNAKKLDEIRVSLQTELEKLRTGNEEKLEKMRETVDEKLQGTLEKRLGESFALVSQRLEQVQKGLGEMQTLASDVGGLKRVLTNVKNRGGWGEVQLARQLEDMLAADQYEENVQIKPYSGDRVEFAIRLPGSGELDSVVYLPIDSKFPQDDYERLLEAQEKGEKVDIDAAVKAVERVVTEQAKLISQKYIEPPFSTDFAIMYLPTEGLFAEVLRRPGLITKLQREQRVMVTGPSTLMSLLNSLQMGFRTVAIEKRSSEVWQVLSAAKHEFEKYGAVWEKLERQLGTAQNTVREAGTRTRALQRKLRDVESSALDSEETEPLSLENNEE